MEYPLVIVLLLFLVEMFFFEYFFHYQMFIFRYSFQNLVATAYLPLLGTEKDYWLQNY